MEVRLNPTTSINLIGNVDIYEDNNNYFYSDGQFINQINSFPITLNNTNNNGETCTVHFLSLIHI